MAGRKGYTDYRYRQATRRLRRSAPPVCWLCEQEIDTDLPYTDRMSWTADHIEPLSLGGKLLGEMRPAHRSCNSSRGNGTGPTPAQRYPTSRRW